MGAAKWLSENAKRYPGREELTAACMKATGISRDHAVKMVRSGKTDLFCSRCGAALEWVLCAAPFEWCDDPWPWLKAGHYRCTDRCTKVAARWKLAFDRVQAGWVEYKFKCSRCGTNLLGPPWMGQPAADSGRPDRFWCPGCGDVD